MSFATVADAIQSRLETVPGMGRVYLAEHWSRDNPESTAFQADFCDAGGRLNYWMIHQVGRRKRAVKGEDSRRRLHRDWIVTVVYAWSSTEGTYADFQSMLDAVSDAFDDGDRTLGGACATHSDVEAYGIRLVAFGAAKLTVNHAQIKFTSEEIV